MNTTQPIRNPEELKIFKNYYRQVKQNPRNYLLIVLGLNSALRISDVLHLTYGDLYDYENKTWKTHFTLKEQKTNKTNRIYMNKEVHSALESCTKPDTKKGSDWIFKGQMSEEKPLSRYQAFRIIKEAAAYAGLPSDISCHSLRKTFGYHAWKQGISPVLLMDIYNHSSYRVTKRYLCIEQDDKDAVFEKIQL